MKDTIFSPCRKWRYTLWREWGPLGPQNLFTECPHLDYYPGRGTEFLQVLALNPSTADEKQDDPTIRRCIDFAKRWGFVGLCMTNIFAWRDTDPEKMKAVPEPIGEANDAYLTLVGRDAGMILAAWGKHGDHMERGQQVIELLQSSGLWTKVHHLGTNSDGSPKHPLYLAAKTQPQQFV